MMYTHMYVIYSRFGHLSTKQVCDRRDVWSPENTEIRCTHPTSDISSIFCRSEKKVYFRPSVYLFYEYFRVLRVKMERFEYLSSALVIFMAEKRQLAHDIWS